MEVSWQAGHPWPQMQNACWGRTPTGSVNSFSQIGLQSLEINEVNRQ